MKNWRLRLHRVIFQSDTKAGKAFDIVLLISILLSVLVVMLDSVASVQERYGDELYFLEWFFTVLFTVEYLVRLLAVARPARYSASFFGVVDLIAIVPTYLSLGLPQTRYLLVVRVLRLLRIFRIFKLAEYMVQAEVITRALRAALPKITVFLFAVGTSVVIIGSLMYLVEGHENGFTSIPQGVYWAIVTLTTVGYGDISPSDRARPDARGLCDDPRVRDHRCSDRDRHGRTDPGYPSTGPVGCLPRMRQGRTRSGRPLLQDLREQTLGKDRGRG